MRQGVNNNRLALATRFELVIDNDPSEERTKKFLTGDTMLTRSECKASDWFERCFIQISEALTDLDTDTSQEP